jgi:hypothetical protein
VGYSLADSPTGLAAWLFLHPGFSNWSYGGDPQQSPTIDDVLDNISLYWFTNTAVSSTRIYWENRNIEIISAGSRKTNLIKLPVAITVFPEDVYTSPESWARRAYPNLIHFSSLKQMDMFQGYLRVKQKKSELPV